MNGVLRGLQDRGLVTRPATAPHGRALPTELTPAGRKQLTLPAPSCARSSNTWSPAYPREKSDDYTKTSRPAPQHSHPQQPQSGPKPTPANLAQALSTSRSACGGYPLLTPGPSQRHQ